MATKILKYNKNKKQFNLNISGRHFIYRKTREEEIREIDDWLINKEPIENRAYITFEDLQGKLHKDVAIKTSGLQLWYADDKNGQPDWNTFVWEIPTKVGKVFIHAKSGLVTWGDKYKSSFIINSNKVTIKYSI